jgi:hypothetical protein
MIRIDPGLRSNGAISWNEEDDILAPQTPALEVAGQSEHESYTRVVDLVFHILPGSDEHDSLSRIGAGTLEDRVDVFVCEGVVRDGVVVLLRSDFEVLFEEDAFELFRSPVNC